MADSNKDIKTIKKLKLVKTTPLKSGFVVLTCAPEL
jgi:hypothetical protein